MFEPSFSVYFGEEKDTEFVGFNSDNGFYAVLKIESPLPKEEGKRLLQMISAEIVRKPPERLSDFDQSILAKFQEFDIPAGFSIACAFISGQKCFLKTTGKGEIYLKREGEFVRILEGNKSASGFVQTADFFIFTTSKFSKIFEDIQTLKKIIGDNDPFEVREAITPQLKTITLFVKIIPQIERKQTEEEVIEQVQQKTPTLQQAWTKVQEYGKRRTLNFLAILFIFLIFLWSVIFGYQRRFDSKLNAEVRSKTELITANLDQAEEVAFLNVSRAQALVQEAKKNLSSLKKSADGKRKKEIASLERLIKEKENSIFKKEEKKFQEFFDLSVDTQGAKGTRLYLDGDEVAVLDKGRAIYIISISKKSLRKESKKEVGKADLVGLDQGSVIFLSPDGVFKIENGKVEKVIAKDKDWGKIEDLTLFNSNIYLLDPIKDKIYKYLPTDKGYSTKSSYFAPSQSIDLSGAVSIAIDSSVYIAFEDRILKYTAGLRDGFNTVFPDKNASLTKILTTSDLEKIYAWDKTNGALYVIAKTGSYERELRSQVLKTAQDLVVFGDHAYILAGSKIYRMSVK